jgi:hypothetical protein
VNDRNAIAPLELDILSSNRKFAVECNGLYWHSEALSVPPRYHQNKSEKAAAAGISLFHVFEDEWGDDIKRSIVKSMIRVKLGAAKKMMARKLKLFEGHPSSVATFMSMNHLDGNTPASKAFWLADDAGNVFCALTLRKPHQQEKWGPETIELARVSTLRDYVVVGGMSKLINAAIYWARRNAFKTMITYRDMRLGGSGAAYESSGFALSHVTQPRFWWTNGAHRIDRFAIRAIPGIATQEDMSFEHKVFKIFGCSNAVYAMNFT